ncbi:LuxR family transcriptional regulator [Lentzea tibetensis]|uniref:LuxR family transcriptional regulator n=1 Tax=Lentzea tibetensis TaxID=2591470 RepID=A0A563EH32_9PSEU|nr:LuxR C-terminal-related transcriptional regulator [Lentzea tibetensis]TWP45839.1 LuxR family transcriptional regulator [Lentzea tibetensis]
MGAAVMPGRKGNLPADATSFVGRKHDLSEVKRLLSESRLVTLTGVGGVGKTRLAVRAAAELRRAFPDGVWLIEVADVTDPDLIVHTVLESLGVHDDTGRNHRTVLVEHLRDRQLLMVLDNCEHLVEACAEIVDSLLRSVPGLRVLATSRERLGIAAEHLWQVAPLPLPDPHLPLPNGAASIYPALTLFADRAGAVEPDFAVTPHNQDKVAQVCHLLGGIPLAIELAAVRLRVLTLDLLVSRLDDTYRVLAAGKRGGIARHQTLQAAVDWSYRLCTMQEQTLWARTSVFSGTFDLGAAQDVCSGGDVRPDDVLELLVGLVDKSVVVREQNDDQTRFRLLEPLRQYGREKLRAAGWEHDVRVRHRDHYVEVAERSERDWFGPAQAEIFAHTRLEHPNLRSALDFCFSADDPLVGAHLAGTLSYYWAGCGVLGEGRHWLDRALALAVEPGPQRAKVLWVNGYVATLQGDLVAAVRMLDECRQYALAVGDEAALAYSTHRMACTHLIGDDLDVAVELFKESRVRYWCLGIVNSHTMLAAVELGIAAMFLSDFPWAEALCEEARAIGEEHGEHWAYAYAIYVLSFCAWARGEVEKADALGRECLRLKRTFNDLLGLVLGMELLAWIAASQGDATRAATLLGATNEIWQSVGYPMFGSRYFGAPHGECETAAFNALGELAFRAAFRAGMDLGLEDAISYAIGDERAAPELAPVRDGTPLTRREQQVADLIADGMSNKEIAAQLVIARRTAEGHVERILQKLGFTSRTQIATWVTERRN